MRKRLSLAAALRWQLQELGGKAQKKSVPRFGMAIHVRRGLPSVGNPKETVRSRQNGTKDVLVPNPRGALQYRC